MRDNDTYASVVLIQSSTDGYLVSVYIEWEII